MQLMYADKREEINKFIDTFNQKNLIIQKEFLQRDIIKNTG